MLPWSIRLTCESAHAASSARCGEEDDGIAEELYVRLECLSLLVRKLGL